MGWAAVVVRESYPTEDDVRRIVDYLTRPVPPARRKGRGKSRGLTQPPQQGTLPSDAERSEDGPGLDDA